MNQRFIRKKKGNALLVKAVLVPVGVFAAIIALFDLGMSSLSGAAERERLESTRRAVVNATVQCYALEGYFPTSVQYLKEHYGLQVDTDKYIVDYAFVAGNMMPEITVLPRFFTADQAGAAELESLGVLR